MTYVRILTHCVYLYIAYKTKYNLIIISLRVADFWFTYSYTMYKYKVFSLKDNHNQVSLKLNTANYGNCTVLRGNIKCTLLPANLTLGH